MSWHLLTGEYPPAPGGVSDYTRQVARALAVAGDPVEVWAPACGAPAPEDPGVCVNWLPGNFGPRALEVLSRGLARRARPRCLVLQYVPHGFGFKAMNVWLCRWLARARRRERLWVLFHEVCFPRAWGQPLRHNLLSTVQRWMARQVGRAAHRRFVTTPAWRDLLHSLTRFPGPTEWMPVPSNIPTEVDPAAVRAVRADLPRAAGQVLGHFGTFSESIAPLLAPPLTALLRGGRGRVGLMIGRGSAGFVARLGQAHPDLAGQLVARDGLGAREVADHLAACDLLLQPYPDGVSGRRTSLMAGLALGVPVLTNKGLRTEPLWADSRAVCLLNDGPSQWVAAAERLLADGPLRDGLGRRARQLYEECFALERTVAVMRARYFADVRDEEKG